MLRRVALSAVLSILVCATLVAGDFVPFAGNWSGHTISAVPISDNIVFVVASGTGNATELGAFQMTSPHYTFLDTFSVAGKQDFTAANGDTLTADFSGQLLPNADGNLEGVLAATITGGTGRFAGATGSYDFHIIAKPAAFGFDSTATINGVISSVGSSH